MEIAIVLLVCAVTVGCASLPTWGLSFMAIHLLQGTCTCAAHLLAHGLIRD